MHVVLCDLLFKFVIVSKIFPRCVNYTSLVFHWCVRFYYVNTIVFFRSAFGLFAVCGVMKSTAVNILNVSSGVLVLRDTWPALGDNNKLFSKVVIPVYILTSSVWVQVTLCSHNTWTMKCLIFCQSNSGFLCMWWEYGSVSSGGCGSTVSPPDPWVHNHRLNQL